jgi:hypothetical protein
MDAHDETYEAPAIFEIGSIADLTQGTGNPGADNLGVSA